MKVKTELLQAFMQKNELSAAILAREMGVAVAEVEKLLDGKAVSEETARRFIYYFGADNAAEYINLAAIGHISSGAVKATCHRLQKNKKIFLKKVATPPFSCL